MQTRTCTKCGQEKPLTNEFFTKDKYDKTGFTYRCSKCRNQQSYEWNRANKDKVKAANLKNKQKRKDFYSSPEGIESSRRTHLKRMYGITLEEYNVMSEKQDHKCVICGGTEMNNKNKVLCVDHNHTTGEIRGLLCGLCNSGLGKFKDNKQLLLNAIKYLEKYE
jgi:hypothetical protein